MVGATFSYNVNETTVSSINSTADAVAVRESSTINRRKLSGRERLLESEPENDEVSKEEGLINKIAQKLQPVEFQLFGEEETEQAGELETGEITTHKKNTLIPHQFLHLHHMKTGGTSIDRLLRCSMDTIGQDC